MEMENTAMVKTFRDRTACSLGYLCCGGTSRPWTDSGKHVYGHQITLDNLTRLTPLCLSGPTISKSNGPCFRYLRLDGIM